MIFIPLIWFSLLLIFILRKKQRIEISALITIAYMVTSFFAIIIEKNDLYWASGMIRVELQLIPSLLYCFIITITILPFTMLPTLKKDNVIQIKNVKLFDTIVYFYYIVYVLFIFFFGNEIVNRVQNPDIAALRQLINNGEDDLGFSNYSGITRIIARLVFIFGSSAMFFHVFYFYSLAFLKKSFKFNVGILIFSTMPIMIGMLSIDRSKTIYWMMSFIATAIFFWGAFDPLRKKQVKSTFIKFFVVFILYLTLITTARYGEQDLGAANSLIVYAGMPFNNFCLFYDRLNLPGISLEMVTPLLSYIISSPDEIKRSILYDRSIDTNVFASFSGMLIREIGVWGSILYSFIFFFLATLLFKNKRKYNITKIFLVVILLYIPYLGIFGLYYASLDREMTVWVILILCYFLKKRPKNRNFHSY